MKLLIKYLSLLIFSGLIIPLYINITAPVKTVFLKTTAEKPHKHTTNTPFFYKHILKNLFPVLKNLN
ncbi:hypothetical protein SAMN05216490_4295 [Mucilaginibacter mallensis]|uniref:Uncharacterized protein n=1 Tax=Mucilaginibacter mallensis TaxID=652787 RepID=A0A1H2BSK4_MUCMA|nr:hypothetical protein [Mucilaginibacter mallensis]SDT60756.1 hypothetical protein SAMN05216490_4295 [Mucilaginibacter mallensis]